MKGSDVIEAVARLLYEQAGYGEDYTRNFPNRSWDKMSPKSKEKWYWKARRIFNLIESMRANNLIGEIVKETL